MPEGGCCSLGGGGIAAWLLSAASSAIVWASTLFGNRTLRGTKLVADADELPQAFCCGAVGAIIGT